MYRLLAVNKGLTRLYRGFSELSRFRRNFLSPSNIAFLEQEHARWLQDKNSVSQSFQAYFEQVESGVDLEAAFVEPPAPGEKVDLQPAQQVCTTLSQENQAVSKALRLRMLVDAYRLYGHQFADIDPLNYPSYKHGAQLRKVLDYRSYGFTDADLDQEINTADGSTGIAEKVPKKWNLRGLIGYLEKVYCGKVGFECMHMLNKAERNFLRDRFEDLDKFEPSKEAKRETFHKLLQDHCFNEILEKRFGSSKRFGDEGLNSTICGLAEILQVAANKGCEFMVLGMAHRGRLSTLHCILDKPSEIMFQEFLEHKKHNPPGHMGDVKYHLGVTVVKEVNGKKVNLSIVPNPSHLEAVDPLVYGRVRAIQDKVGERPFNKAVGIIIHGDAAVAGQGVVYESIEMQDLKDYTTGGIIHIVMNNQIGFTTDQHQARSTFYCTEVAKVVGAPIFHVNADEPDLVDKCMQIAYEYRDKFNKDIFIDIVGYRKYGHNELDQPTFTQPLMYEKVKSMKPVFDKYCQKLISQGVITEAEIKEAKEKLMHKYEEAYKNALNNTIKTKWEPGDWEEYYPIKECEDNKTGVNKQLLEEVFAHVSAWPKDFNVHPTIQKIYEERKTNFTNNQGLDMATMESLAFGTLLKEGYDVRLSGQDVERGTFSHRHALLSDQKSDRPKHMFLKTISPNVNICNSHLSEFGVLGFEYGYSITNLNSLVIWEAQFGDFANGAQIIIDNFIVSAETKWNQSSGIVLNLPHGMDGQGPEHSSGRIERFLEMSDDNTEVDLKLSYEEQLERNNIQVVVCSATANYFHVLRRQMKREFRKPLVLFNSKKLLKSKPASSKLEEIQQGTEFTPVYDDASNGLAPPEKIKQVILCCGQFYYDLKDKRDELKNTVTVGLMQDTAIVRIEQLAPLPHNQIGKILAKYKNARVVWAQEEHENQGAWTYLRSRLRNILKKHTGKSELLYEGRRPLAASAGGTLKRHKEETSQILERLFSRGG